MAPSVNNIENYKYQPYRGKPAELYFGVDVSDVVEVGEHLKKMARKLGKERPLDIVQPELSRKAYRRVAENERYVNTIRKKAAANAPRHTQEDGGFSYASRERLVNPKNYYVRAHGGGQQTNARPMMVVGVSKNAGGSKKHQGLPRWVHEGTEERWTRKGKYRGEIGRPGKGRKKGQKYYQKKGKNPWLLKNMPDVKAYIANKYEFELNNIIAEQFDRGMKGFDGRVTNTERQQQLPGSEMSAAEQAKQKKLKAIDKKQKDQQKQMADLKQSQRVLESRVKRDKQKLAGMKAQSSQKGKTREQIARQSSMKKEMSAKIKTKESTISDLKRQQSDLKAEMGEARIAKSEVMKSTASKSESSATVARTVKSKSKTSSQKRKTVSGESPSDKQDVIWGQQTEFEGFDGPRRHVEDVGGDSTTKTSRSTKASRPPKQTSSKPKTTTSKTTSTKSKTTSRSKAAPIGTAEPVYNKTLSQLPSEIQNQIAMTPTQSGSMPSVSTQRRRAKKFVEEINAPTKSGKPPSRGTVNKRVSRARQKAAPYANVTYGGQTRRPAPRTVRHRKQQAKTTGGKYVDQRTKSGKTRARTARAKTAPARIPSPPKSTYTSVGGMNIEIDNDTIGDLDNPYLTMALDKYDAGSIEEYGFEEHDTGGYDFMEYDV